MYSYRWDSNTGGYVLLAATEKFVAAEVRPVYAQELALLGFDAHFKFDADERRPICWAKHNVYFHCGEEIARIAKVRYGHPIPVEFLAEPRELTPVDTAAMVSDPENRMLVSALVADAQKRIKEMYDRYMASCDIAYIGFSGGKDSMLLLDLCHKTLPLSVPVVFSDTDMELPDTYKIWEEVQRRYSERTFIKAKSPVSALSNWNRFGPPSQALRWCCSVHKSAPAILALKELTGKPSARLLAFVGVRGDESLRRNTYEDVGVGTKNSNQVNAMPILSWGAHELFLYSFEHDLPVNDAYRKGLPRVGCIFCPMAATKTNSIVAQIYPDETHRFEAAIEQNVSREFASDEDRLAFIGEGGWHARQSGVSLKSVVSFPGRRRIENGVELSAHLDRAALFEWLKAQGRMERIDEETCELCDAQGRRFRVGHDAAGGESVVRFTASDGQEMAKAQEKLFRFAVQKSMACVGCGECQAECPTGALSFTPDVSIDAGKCIHCLRCYDAQEGCIRFFSMRYAGGTNVTMNGINKYLNFGLRPDWIVELVELKERFRSSDRLGVRMIPSAVTWFRESGLIGAATAIEPTRLLSVAERSSAEDKALWEAIWMNLANVSPLVKWYVASASVGDGKTQNDIADMLEANGVASASVRKGALSSLCSLLKFSPLGSGERPVVRLETKGARVVSLTRVPHEVEDMALLYGLFAMAIHAEQTSFSVSSMMTADFSAKYVSPIVAFGMPVAEFKQQCQGLADRHGDFIHCNFTLGLDEVRIKTDEKTLDDVVDLMLKN